MSDKADRLNEYAKKHGAKKEIYDEDLKFKYQNKSIREYTASIYGFPYRDFPATAFTSERIYLQWCVQVSGMMPDKRTNIFHQFIQDRLAEAEEEEILPNMEEGVEVGVVVVTILKNKIRNCRNFDAPGNPESGDELGPGEWCFMETAEDSKCGLEVFIKYEGLKACIQDQVAFANTETKMARREVVAWLMAHGRHYGTNATINRHRCAYVLPYSLVERFEVFALRASSFSHAK